jgi:two-component system sensor histidine kinase VicK
MTSNNPINSHTFLEGGGKMGALIRSHDWSQTPLGNPETWPECLKIATSIILSTPFPMYIAWGKEYTQLYNDGYRPILGSTKHPQALGISTRETFAEIWYIIGSMFEEVMEGKAVGFPNFMLPLNRNGYVEECYFDFSYSSIRDEHGTVGGVLVTVIETTEQVQTINDLKADTAAQHKLHTVAREANENFESAIKQLEESEMRFQNLVREASVGIIVLIGKELKVKVVNQSYADLIERTTDELFDKELFTIIPEVENVFRPVIDNVRETGKPLYLFEQPYKVFKDGRTIEGYLNLSYQPYKEKDGTITGVIVLCQDVAEQVRSKQELLRLYEQLRLSKEAAQLGTFDMDLKQGTMHWDTRCRELFGINHNDDVSYEQDFLPGLHSEDRERVEELIANLLTNPNSNGDYDVEYRTVGVVDGSIRWVRAKGKVFFNEDHVAERFIGSVVEITDYKDDEQRKSDFIGMVSHEMKTPLTSLKGYVQMLYKRAQKDNDAFRMGALTSVERQVNKMTAMINGFLNMSRLESGKIHLEMVDFDLDTLVTETVNEYKPIANSHELVFEACPRVPIKADKDKIGYVITNLLSNAVKYSPDKGKVEVNCEIVGGVARVSVRDKGFGIEPEDTKKLFDRYYRVKSQNTRHIAGFGIGLYLSAEIIARHGGNIWVDSKVGNGSTFYFTLPISN